MTDYLPYTWGEYAVDAPATALHFERWFRNWEAGFEGAWGAPRLRLGALERLNPGGVYQASMGGELEAAPNGTEKSRVGIIQYGTLRMFAEFRNASGVGTAYLDFCRRRNWTDTVLATFSAGSISAWATHTLDVAVQPADQLYFRGRGTVNSYPRIGPAGYSTDGSFLWPAPLLQTVNHHIGL